MTNKHSAVARAAMRSTNCHSCIPLADLRQSGQLEVPLIFERLRACRCRLDCVVARDSGYNTIAFMSDAVDGRSAAWYRNTIVRQNPPKTSLFYRSSPPSAAARRAGQLNISNLSSH